MEAFFGSAILNMISWLKKDIEIQKTYYDDYAHLSYSKHILQFIHMTRWATILF